MEKCIDRRQSSSRIRARALPTKRCSLAKRGTEQEGSRVFVVHPESFRYNAQNAIAFSRRNRPRVDRNDEFACVYLRSRAFACMCLHSFASTVRDRPRARTYVRR